MLFRILLIQLLLVTLISASRSSAAELALVGGKIYPSPDEPPIYDGTILIRNGLIQSIGPDDEVKPPAAATVIDCHGLVVTAGFWNSHVHILTPQLLHAEKSSDEQITSQLETMFTRWGFTTVFDIASVLGNTNLIRRRIESGKVIGPKILTVGEPFWVRTPIYIRAFLQANHIDMPEVTSTAAATGRVRQQLRNAADGIKVFTGSVETHGAVVNMPLELTQAIVAEAHRAGKPVFSHPANDEGVEIALKSGVDVLAHTDPSGKLWDSELAGRLKAAHLALIPTLTLFEVEGKKLGESPDAIQKWVNKGVEQLQTYAAADGEILFGTDIGYIEQFDTREEFTLMARAGMTYQKILASLTTNPARRFGSSPQHGHIAEGAPADLVVLSNDPAKDVTAFSKIRYTIRAGKIIFAAH